MSGRSRNIRARDDGTFRLSPSFPCPRSAPALAGETELFGLTWTTIYYSLSKKKSIEIHSATNRSVSNASQLPWRSPARGGRPSPSFEYRRFDRYMSTSPVRPAAHSPDSVPEAPFRCGISHVERSEPCIRPTSPQRIRPSEPERGHRLGQLVHENLNRQIGNHDVEVARN